MTDASKTESNKDAKPMNGDPRPKTRGEEREEAITTPSRSELLDQLTQAEAALALTREQADDNLRNWQRTAADFSNFKRRTDEERTAVVLMANAVLIGRILSVLDDFDRALESVPIDVHEGWLDGIRLVERKLQALLEAEGVTPIEAIGQAFDPTFHEAVVHEDTTEYPDNTVIDEVQRGYLLHERVLRPSLVRVANNPGK
jgi:molecular chaperone GrpE